MELKLKLPDDLKAPRKPFTPCAQYSRFGDMLKVYWDDEPGWDKQLTPEIIIVIGFETRRVVGVKIVDIATKVSAHDAEQEE